MPKAGGNLTIFHSVKGALNVLTSDFLSQTTEVQGSGSNDSIIPSLGRPTVGGLVKH